MVALGISEFTFGFAFLFEQTRRNWGNLLAVPVLPNLWDENRLGWDAHLPASGIDFYYQFKLSEFLIRPYAKYRLDRTYNDLYFRISLHKHDRNKQHRLLMELSATNSETYYVAPETDNFDAFNQAFLEGNITAHSRLIPLSECDVIDDGEQHFITYQTGDPIWIQHSKPSYHEKSFFGKDLEDVYRNTANRWQQINEEYAASLFERVSQKTFEIRGGQPPLIERPQEELLDFDPRGRPRAEVIDQAAKILSVFYGVNLVIVGGEDNRSSLRFISQVIDAKQFGKGNSIL